MKPSVPSLGESGLEAKQLDRSTLARPPLHGGVLPRELEGLETRPHDVLDFSVSINPYGPGPAVRKALADASVRAYPDPEAWRARGRLSDALGIARQRIQLGNGAAELLWILARLFTGPGRRALIVEPTFGEFRRAVLACGGEAVEWRAHEDDDFTVHLDQICEKARQVRPSVLYLCAPTSPCGHTIDPDAIVRLSRALPGLPVVLDQAFVSLSDSPEDLLVPMPDDVCCVRSLTKELGTPGVRIGYLLGAPALAEAVESQRPPWTVSAAAQAAASAAPDDHGWLEECRKRLRLDRQALLDGIAGLGLSAVPTSTFYVTVAMKEPATPLRERLLREKRILIRDCTSFGMPRHIRLGVQGPGPTDRLLAGLARSLC